MMEVGVILTTPLVFAYLFIYQFRTLPENFTMLRESRLTPSQLRQIRLATADISQRQFEQILAPLNFGGRNWPGPVTLH